MAGIFRNRMLPMAFLAGVVLTFSKVAKIQASQLEYTEVKLDICQREYLNITCSRGEVILMMSAENGIMRLGRCFRTEGVNSVKEVIGCKTEALDHLDAICSGRRSCLFQYPDDYLYNNNNCPNIFTSFMEVSYICVKVEQGDQNQCRQQQRTKVEAHQGFISSEISLTSTIGSQSCPWLIETHPGQHINVTIYHFTNTSKPRDTTRMTSHGYSVNNPYKTNYQSQIPSSVSVDSIRSCQNVDVGVISEAGKQKTVNTCSSRRDVRIIERYVSRTNALEFRFEGQRTLRSAGRFLVEFNVAGCPDLEIPSDTWMKREEDRLKVKCNSSTQTWFLICSDNKWVGEVGNCTLKVGYTGFGTYHIDGGPLAEPFPYGILFVVAIGVAIGIVFGGGTLALLVLYNKKKSRKRGILGGPGKQYSSMAYHDTNTRAWLHATQQCPPKGSQEQLYIDEGIVRDIQSLPPAALYGDTVMSHEGMHHDAAMVGVNLSGGGGVMSPQQHPLQQQQTQQHIGRGGGGVGGMGETKVVLGQLDVGQKALGPEHSNLHAYERPTS